MDREEEFGTFLETSFKEMYEKMLDGYYIELYNEPAYIVKLVLSCLYDNVFVILKIEEDKTKKRVLIIK